MAASAAGIEGEDREELKENLDQLAVPGHEPDRAPPHQPAARPELVGPELRMLKLWAAIDGAAKAGRARF